MAKNFLKIAQGVDVGPLALEIARQPGLWNQHMRRLTIDGSPHRETDDIWLRYKESASNEKSGDWTSFYAEHDPVWYDGYYALPAARKLIFDLMARVEGERLGGIIIYRVPAGKQIYVHTDEAWHAQYYEKFNFSIKSQPGCVFYYPKNDEGMESNTGDVFWFKNTVPHGVLNQSKEDQIIMTVCIKTHQKEA